MTSVARHDGQPPRALMIYPWSLEDRTGALAALYAYGRALRGVGMLVDVFGPGRTVHDDGRGDSPFERRFAPPSGPDELVAGFEQIGEHLADPSLPVAAGRDEHALASAAALAGMADYQLVCVMYTRCHTIARLLPAHIPRVLFTLDLDAVVDAQEAAITGRPRRYSIESEVRRMRDFDLTTVVGPDDYRRVRRVDMQLPLVEATLPFHRAVEHPRVRQACDRRLLWLSAAAPFHSVSFQWFWQHVWPVLRKHPSRPTLVTAGYITDVARELGAAADPQVELRGVVPESSHLFGEADVMLAPYYYGDGIKVKVLEAIAHGTPVITTTRGLSNTRLVPGEHVAVADDAAQFVRRTTVLLDCPEERERQAAAALEYLGACHDPEVAHRALRDAVRQLLARPRRPPARSVVTHGTLTASLRRRIPAVVRSCERHGIESVAVYGAGMHTAALLPVWHEAGGPSVRAIVVSGLPEHESLGGVPVVSADELDATSVDAVVLSSMMFERQMAGGCAERWPELPVIPIWQRVSRPQATSAMDMLPGAFMNIRCTAAIPGDVS